MEWPIWPLHEHGTHKHSHELQMSWAKWLQAQCGFTNHLTLIGYFISYEKWVQRVEWHTSTLSESVYPSFFFSFKKKTYVGTSGNVKIGLTLTHANEFHCYYTQIMPSSTQLLELPQNRTSTNVPKRGPPRVPHLEMTCEQYPWALCTKFARFSQWKDTNQ